MKYLFGTTLLFLLAAVSAIVVLKSPDEAFSFMVGSTFILANTLLITITVKLLFSKKKVAWPVGIIVFKYPLLGVLLYFVVAKGMVNLTWTLIGMGVLLPAVIIFALLLIRKPQIGMVKN